MPIKSSFNILGDIWSKESDSWVEGHVLEFSFSVHLKTSTNSCVNWEVEVELFAGILWVGSKSFKYFSFFGFTKFDSWDDVNSFLFVHLLIKFSVSIANLFQVYKPLVFGKNFQEFNCLCLESSSRKKTFVELSYFFHSNTSIFSEILKIFWFLIKSHEVLCVFINAVENILFRSSNE